MICWKKNTSLCGLADCLTDINALFGYLFSKNQLLIFFYEYLIEDNSLLVRNKTWLYIWNAYNDLEIFANVVRTFQEGLFPDLPQFLEPMNYLKVKIKASEKVPELKNRCMVVEAFINFVTEEFNN